MLNPTLLCLLMTVSRRKHWWTIEMSSFKPSHWGIPRMHLWKLQQKRLSKSSVNFNSNFHIPADFFVKLTDLLIHTGLQCGKMSPSRLFSWEMLCQYDDICQFHLWGNSCSFRPQKLFWCSVYHWICSILISITCDILTLFTKKLQLFQNSFVLLQLSMCVQFHYFIFRCINKPIDWFEGRCVPIK